MASTSDYFEQLKNIEQTDVVIMRNITGFSALNTDILCPHLSFTLVERGNITGLYDLQPLTQHKNELVCLMPGHIIHPLGYSDDFLATIILISDRLRQDLQFHVFSHDYRKFNPFPLCTLSDIEVQHLFSFVEQLEAVLKHTNEELPHRYDMLLAILSVGYEFINYYRQEQDKAWRNDQQNEMLYRFCALVSDHYKESREVAFYAERFNLSPKYFSKRISLLTGGMSPADWIERYVAVRAKYIIRTQLPTVKELTYALGFSEPASFCRFFKRVTGMTPQQFKAQLASV